MGSDQMSVMPRIFSAKSVKALFKLLLMVNIFSIAEWLSTL